MTSHDPDRTDHEPHADWSSILTRLQRGQDLDRSEAVAAMDDIMAGRVGQVRMAAFLMGLRVKGETPDEVAAAAQAMRGAARPWPLTEPCIDIVGTGGDNSGTVNISTLAAVIVAACGVQVVKHGNRAATSASGAADVLEALGLALQAEPDDVAAVAADIGLGFAFAPVFHPAMRHAAPVRRELGVPTVFNILGPLTNPAAPRAGLIGCADARLAPIMAQVFADRGESMLVVRGDDGWDEISPQATTRMWVAESGSVTVHTLEPDQVGIAGIAGAALAGGDAAHNAEVARIIFGLPRADPRITIRADPAAVSAVAVANAAAALAIARRAGLGGDPGSDGRGSDVRGSDVRGSDAGGAGPARESVADWAGLIAAEIPRARAAVESGAAGRLLSGWIARLHQRVSSRPAPPTAGGSR